VKQKVGCEQSWRKQCETKWCSETDKFPSSYVIPDIHSSITDSSDDSPIGCPLSSFWCPVHSCMGRAGSSGTIQGLLGSDWLHSEAAIVLSGRQPGRGLCDGETPGQVERDQGTRYPLYSSRILPPPSNLGWSGIKFLIGNENRLSSSSSLWLEHWRRSDSNPCFVLSAPVPRISSSSR
jgi:hypothetical protein